MSLKETIEAWNAGIAHAVAGQYDDAIDRWTEMSEPGAKIYYNIATVFLKLGNLEDAERHLVLSVKKDPHLAIACFHKGCLHLQKNRYPDALSDFDTALKNLRGNLLIDYKQLGLQYKLYSCEIMYNRAYTYHCMGQTTEAIRELEEAKRISSSTSESRHRVIAMGLEKIKSDSSILPYKLPEKALMFHPPRNKTESVKPIDFLGKAKVLSSVVDQDSYVGFVGVQDEKKNKSGSASPHSRSPSPRRGDVTSRKRVKASPRLSAPNVPPPAPNMKIKARTFSLRDSAPARQSGSPYISVPGIRPAKPDVAPPPFIPEGYARKPSKNVTDQKLEKIDSSTERNSRAVSPSSVKSDTMTVKVHYSTTRAIRMSSKTSYGELQETVCKKFGLPPDSLTLWCKKKNGELNEIVDNLMLQRVITHLDDGFRLTLWAYDKHELSLEDEVLREVVAVYDYSGQFGDELSFSAGDKIQVTVDINGEWCEGACKGSTGIFPISYVKNI